MPGRLSSFQRPIFFRGAPFLSLRPCSETELLKQESFLFRQLVLRFPGLCRLLDSTGRSGRPCRDGRSPPTLRCSDGRSSPSLRWRDGCSRRPCWDRRSSSTLWCRDGWSTSPLRCLDGRRAPALRRGGGRGHGFPPPLRLNRSHGLGWRRLLPLADASRLVGGRRGHRGGHAHGARHVAVALLLRQAARGALVDARAVVEEAAQQVRLCSQPSMAVSEPVCSSVQTNEQPATLLLGLKQCDPSRRRGRSMNERHLKQRMQ